MKTIKVRTSYTGCPYITAGKVYTGTDVRGPYTGIGRAFRIEDDKGATQTMLQHDSPHLNGRGWEILPEGPSLTDELAEALQKVCNKYASTLCAHDETYRGGLIWEICAHCGAKWADDEGGKPPYKENETLAMAEAVLAKYKESQQ